YAHNTLRSSATGMSPFECQFGYTPSRDLRSLSSTSTRLTEDAGNPPPPRIIGGQPAYTVHRVLDVRQLCPFSASLFGYCDSLASCCLATKDFHTRDPSSRPGPDNAGQIREYAR
ncbi:hypothetical protein QTP70_023899, partial [Hemibagrus guttatus]